MTGSSPPGFSLSPAFSSLLLLGNNLSPCCLRTTNTWRTLSLLSYRVAKLVIPSWIFSLSKFSPLCLSTITQASSGMNSEIINIITIFHAVLIPCFDGVGHTELCHPARVELKPVEVHESHGRTIRHGW